MLTGITYADVFRPAESRYGVLYDVALIVGGSLLIALCAQIAIGWPVPVTGQTFGVLMIGALFGGRRGSLCVLVYIMEGVAGLPVFSHGRCGIAVLSGPTGGYLAGFVAAAYVTGLLAERGWDRRFGTTVLAMGLGNVVIYAFGLSWLFWLISAGRLSTGIDKVLAVGLYPFIVGDMLKIALAAVVLPSGWKLLKMTKPATKKSR